MTLFREKWEKKSLKAFETWLAVKRMARSKKVIGMVKKYGHGISYRTIEDLETELTFTITSSSNISLPDLVPDSSLTFCIAYDNFSHFLETLPDKDTLHNQVSIVYQFVSEETSRVAAKVLENCPSAIGDSTSRRKRRRKTFKSFGVGVEPYYKKPKVSSAQLIPLGFTDWEQIPESYQLAKVNNLLWMIQFRILPKSTPDRVGWNAQQ